jgi:hypothetical protein
MTSERKIDANRRNARRSTGPRSVSGRKHASRNAFRHGLSLQTANANLADKIEKLAQRIVGDCKEETKLQLARTAAEAELELERVRKVRLSLIGRAIELGSITAPKYFRSAKEEARWLFEMELYSIGMRRTRPPELALINPVGAMPKDPSDRIAEAVRRILPELLSIDRYERRAAGRRDRAIRKILKIRTLESKNL